METYYNKNNIEIYNIDNLELLRSMSDNSVNLIYCDILYNTGKVFDDYNDNLGAPKEAVEWYRPRILEMKRVLANNGSIFLHCNWRLDSYIRMLMDEIFGMSNFRNYIYRKHSKKRGFVSNFDSQMDIILYYVKDKENFVFNEIKDKTERIIPLFENGYVKERSKSIVINNVLVDFEKKNKHLLINYNLLNELIKKDEVILIDGLPYRRQMLLRLAIYGMKIICLILIVEMKLQILMILQNLKLY